MIIDLLLYTFDLNSLKFIIILLGLTVGIHVVKIYIITMKKIFLISKLKNCKQKLEFFITNKINFNHIHILSKFLNLAFVAMSLIDGSVLWEPVTEAFKTLTIQQKIELSAIVLFILGSSYVFYDNPEFTKMFLEVL